MLYKESGENNRQRCNMQHKDTNALTKHTSKYSRQDMRLKVFHLLYLVRVFISNIMSL